MRIYLNHKKGFTLIELLVVVLIIGILAAVALPQYEKAVLKSRYVQLMNISKPLANAADLYYLENGVLPTKFEDLDIELPAAAEIAENGTYAEWGNGKYNVVLWLNSTETNGSIGGTYDHRVQYLQYFGDTKVRHCRAKEDDEMANGICKGMKGELHATYDGFNSYLLP